MIVVKKINNNVAICLDSGGHELIAMGKGIGFPKVPYELTDLHKIDRTFYDVDAQYLSLLNEIPDETIRFTTGLVDRISARLPYKLNANIVIALADHIAFTVERAKKGVYIQMPSLYEMEHNYPAEIKASREIYNEVQKHYKVRLPQDEIQGIAMHFINARTENAAQPLTERTGQQFDEILDQTTKIIEQKLNVHINRDTFSYARFASHLQYLFQRVFTQQYDSGSLNTYNALREEYPEIAQCVDEIASYYQETWGMQLTEEEKLYLIMHTNRICVKEGL